MYETLLKIVARTYEINPNAIVELRKFSRQDLIDLCAMALILLEEENNSSTPAQVQAPQWAH